MTVATNALLEGRGARTALIATEGFTDIVALGRQNRAELYRLCAARPAPLVPARAPLRRPRADDARRPAARADRAEAARSSPRQRRRGRARGGRGRAAALLPPPRARARARRRRCAARAARASTSRSRTRWSGTFREYERAATTEVDAALSPLLAGYLRRLVERVPRGQGCPSRRSCSPTAA